jgi:hypothetical protein
MAANRLRAEVARATHTYPAQAYPGSASRGAPARPTRIRTDPVPRQTGRCRSAVGESRSPCAPTGRSPVSRTTMMRTWIRY